MAYGNGLTFYDDSELFDIDEHSGTITFSPTKEDVGSEIVIVRVMDEQGHIEEVSFVVEISDLTASEIEIDPLPYLTAFVGTPFTHFINVETDEQVYFSDDSNLFEIDVNTGEISFMPTSSKVGEHIFEVTVLDSSGNQNIVEGTLLVVE